MATSVTGGVERFLGMNVCWEEDRRNSKDNSSCSSLSYIK